MLHALLVDELIAVAFILLIGFFFVGELPFVFFEFLFEEANLNLRRGTLARMLGSLREEYSISILFNSADASCNDYEMSGKEVDCNLGVANKRWACLMCV